MKLVQLLNEQDDLSIAKQMYTWAQSFVNAVAATVGSLCNGVFVGRKSEAFSCRFYADIDEDTEFLYGIIEKLLRAHPTPHMELLHKRDVTKHNTSHGIPPFQEVWVWFKPANDDVTRIITIMSPEHKKVSS